MRMIFFLFLMLSPAISSAFEITVGTKVDEARDTFEDGKVGSAVHENLLLESINRVNLKLLPSENRINLANSVVAGVRWNDDPLSLLHKHKKDFLVHFLDSARRSREGRIDVKWDLFYRSHSGDMQFLHSMASSAKETAKETCRYISTWLEFCYKVATGEIPYDYRFRSIQHHMSERGAEIFKKVMISPSGSRGKWTSKLMFGMECDRDFSFFRNGRFTELKYKYHELSRDDVMNYALGSAVHIIQDSYCRSHTKRESDEVVQFGYFRAQATGRHGEADKKYFPGDVSPELIVVTKRVIELVLLDRRNGNGSDWDEFNMIVNREIFRLRDEGTLPGDLGYR
jgi:hypothetical protein